MSSSSPRLALIDVDAPVRLQVEAVMEPGFSALSTSFGDAGELLEAQPCALGFFGLRSQEDLSSLRQLRKRHKLPLLAVVHAEQRALIKPALAAGANDFIQLPCAPVELKARIRRWLEPSLGPGDLVAWLHSCGKRTVPLPEGGLCFGEHKVRAQLSNGEWTRVFKVRDGVGAPWALKLSKALFTGEVETAQRFGKERDILKSIDHPHIVQLHKAGELDDVEYLLLQFIEGPSLMRLIRTEGPPTPRRSFEIGRDVARAMVYLHERRILHRDIKPTNILLDKSGRAVLIDFGLAFRADDPRITSSAAFVGTPGFVPAEEAAGGMPTPARDVFSLGVTLFYLLTGRRLRPGDDPRSWLEASELSKQVQKMLRHALLRDRARRATARELLAALEACLEEIA